MTVAATPDPKVQNDQTPSPAQATPAAGTVQPPAAGADGGAGKTPPDPAVKQGDGQGSGQAPPPPPDPTTFKLKLAEGGPFDEHDLAHFRSEAKELGWDEATTQKMVDRQSAAVLAAHKRYTEDLQADPELGGDKFPVTDKAARRGRDILAPPDSPERAFLDALLARSGLNNHKELVRIFVRAGQMAADDGGDGGGKGGGRGNIPLEDRLYRKKK